MSFTIKSPDVFAIATGVWTTVSPADLVATGLREVTSGVATLVSDPLAGAEIASVGPALAPGMILVKTWTPTAAGNTTLKPATAFGLKVCWIAFGR